MVDMIVQNVSTEGHTHISFTVPREQAERAERQAEAVAQELGGTAAVDCNIAKITVAGVGMRTHTGVAARIFDALEKVPVPVHMVNTSEVDISIVVDQSHAAEAADVLRRTFGLIG
jgi:aspartate kinase